MGFRDGNWKERWSEEKWSFVGKRKERKRESFANSVRVSSPEDPIPRFIPASGVKKGKFEKEGDEKNILPCNIRTAGLSDSSPLSRLFRLYSTFSRQSKERKYERKGRVKGESKTTNGGRISNSWQEVSFLLLSVSDCVLCFCFSFDERWKTTTAGYRVTERRFSAPAPAADFFWGMTSHNLLPKGRRSVEMESTDRRRQEVRSPSQYRFLRIDDEWRICLF